MAGNRESIVPPKRSGRSCLGRRSSFKGCKTLVSRFDHRQENLWTYAYSKEQL